MSRIFNNKLDLKVTSVGLILMLLLFNRFDVSYQVPSLFITKKCKEREFFLKDLKLKYERGEK
jgi:hypothetical protein